MLKDGDFYEETQTIEPTYSTDYEIERNKPMPNRIHGRIQHKISMLLGLKYENQFDFESEVTLDTQPKSSTPDICIYPKKTLRLKEIEAKATEMPLTTIEIQSPSQAPEALIEKAWELYFPAGVKSAWVIIPSTKAIRIILPDDQNFLYTHGEANDPATGISVPVEKVFEGIDW